MCVCVCLCVCVCVCVCVVCVCVIFISFNTTENKHRISGIKLNIFMPRERMKKLKEKKGRAGHKKEKEGK